MLQGFGGAGGGVDGCPPDTKPVLEIGGPWSLDLSQQVPVPVPAAGAGSKVKNEQPFSAHAVLEHWVQQVAASLAGRLPMEGPCPCPNAVSCKNLVLSSCRVGVEGGGGAVVLPGWPRRSWRLRW